MASRRLAYSAALEGGDKSAILDALAEDVIIRVAVHDQPLQGKEVAEFLFGVLQEELGDFRVTDEIVERQNAVVLFETTIGDNLAQGLNVVRMDDSGVVRDLTVFFRPLQALQLIAEVIGSRMAERFGALDESQGQ